MNMFSYFVKYLISVIFLSFCVIYQKLLFPIQCYYINTRKYVTSYKHRKDRVGRAGQLEAKRGASGKKAWEPLPWGVPCRGHYLFG